MLRLPPGMELLPCPLCGGKAQVERGSFMIGVTCPCSSHVFYGAERSVSMSVAAWNRRAGREADDDQDK